MMTSDQNSVVLGGGIAGIFAAIWLKNKGHHVTLIEKDENLGGLLRSRSNEHGDHFDFGTHFISPTGDSEIDSLLFDKKNVESWIGFDRDMPGSFLAGHLIEDCGFPHTQYLAPPLYHQGCADLLDSIGKSKGDLSNLNEHFYFLFGKTFTDEIFKPLYKARFGIKSLDEMISGCEIIFGHRRLVMSTPQATRILKSIPALDDRLGFHSVEEGSRSAKQYYPKVGGVQDWVSHLEEECESLGIVLKRSCTVSGVKIVDRKVQEVYTNKNERIVCDNLIVSIPPALLLRSANIQSAQELAPPRMTFSYIVNLVYSENYLVKSYYLYNHDHKHLPFRITLYGNFQPITNGRYRLTVEVISAEQMDTNKIIELCEKELISMKVIAPTNRVIYSECAPLKEGIPIFDSNYHKSAMNVLDITKSEMKNALVIGRYRASSWLMSDVLIEAKLILEEEFGHK